MEFPQGADARSRLIYVSVIGAVFAVAFVVRWLTFNGLGGDDHWALWAAANFLKGDLPFRDFVDVGAPLHWAMSALAQWVVGYRVVGEVVLGTLLIAFGSTIAFHLAWQASRSVGLAAVLTATALLLVSTTKLYSYPKIFVYPLGLWLCWRYIDKPSLGRAAALAAGVAIAWGYRHDHGFYLGLAALTALLATHWPEGWRTSAARLARFAAALLVLIGPYLAVIQINEGIAPYLVARLDLARQFEAAPGVSRVHMFTVDESAPAHWFRIDPPRSAQVQVDWKPEVTPGTRTAVEKQYSLTAGVHPKKKRLYEYFLTDASRGNLVALLNEPRIDERRGITPSYREGADSTQVLSDIVATEPAPDDAPPGVRARMFVRWNADLSEGEMTALERQYGLVDPTPDRNKWDYALTDVSTANIRAIVEDSRVYDTGLIDRSVYRPMEESSLVRLQRAVAPLRISVAPRYWHQLNGVVLLYYLFYALPAIALVMLVRDRIRGTARAGLPHAGAKILAAAVMLTLVNVGLVRKLGYLPDHGHLAAILGAWVIGRGFSGLRARTRAAAVPAAAGAALLLAWVFAAMTFVPPLNVVATAGFNEGVRGATDKAIRSFRGLATSPPIDEYAPPGTTGDRGLLRYLYECTRPDDRIWLLTQNFPLGYYTERRVVGHLSWSNGFLATPEHQRRTIERVEKEEVPFVISFGGEGPLSSLDAYDTVREYVARRYTRRYAVPEDKVERGLSIWLLSDGRREPTGTYELFGLPCFK